MRHHYDRIVSTHLMFTCLHRTGISNNIFVFCNLNFPLFLIYFAVYTYFKLLNIFFNSGVLLHMLIFMFGNVYFLSITTLDIHVDIFQLSITILTSFIHVVTKRTGLCPLCIDGYFNNVYIFIN